MTDVREKYAWFLQSETPSEGATHWERAKKRTFTLFNALMDQDLTELVAVLRAYPAFVPVVCDHFRYSYSYSENAADVGAMSELFDMARDHLSGQFVRNVLLKLPKLDTLGPDEVAAFLDALIGREPKAHEVILAHYRERAKGWLQKQNLHPLQKIAIAKRLKPLEEANGFDYICTDRDAGLEIPYLAYQ